MKVQLLVFLCIQFIDRLCNCTLSIGNYWIVQLKSDENSYNISDTDNLSEVINIANELGYTFDKKLTGFDNTYIFQQIHSTDSTGKRAGAPLKPLHNDPRVEWADQQVPLERSKRDGDYLYNYFYEDLEDNFISNEFMSKSKQLFNDEFWSQEWYLQDKRHSKHDYPKLDLNVLPVYQRGITGKGVRIAVLDDGLEYTHDDLFDNYDPEISYDCNNDRSDPMPNEPLVHNSHGTRCAGEIAMIANNGICGVGIAYNSHIGGIKMLGGRVFDMVEGMALGFALNKIDIYSSSWGPTDNGKSLEKPGRMAMYALERGVKMGRNGRGSIYIWASGNGGSSGDNCNCDGYAASIYTITIGSASQKGTIPWYGEKCSSIMAVTYSSGTFEDQMIVTSDINNSCTNKHTGTSASAPLAAGIVALGLEANPQLTWRDVQHLIVYTSEYAPIKNNEGWQENGAGLLYNIGFGFGLMNADALVTMGMNWTNVAPQIIDNIYPYAEPHVQKIYKESQCIFKYFGNINHLEHIEVSINVQYTIRGALSFYLTSPQKTRVQLLGKRRKDTSPFGFNQWKLMSVATWSENPLGEWLLEIQDDQTIFGNGNFGRIYNCSLILYGTEKLPKYLQKNGPRKYNMNYVRQI